MRLAHKPTVCSFWEVFMSYIKPVPPGQLGDLEPLAKQAYASFGFVPNTVYTMAHRPELVRGFLGLAHAVIRGGIEPTLRTLVVQVASTAAGCRYCQAHGARQASVAGVDPAKIAAAWDFETDARFSEAERAALRLARDASVLPNAVTAGHFDDLKQHFNEGQIVDIVGTVALMGFLNRWNDTFATALEPDPYNFAQQHLGVQGWTPGKHEVGRG